jgi:hypothetical protein
LLTDANGAMSSRSSNAERGDGTGAGFGRRVTPEGGFGNADDDWDAGPPTSNTSLHFGQRIRLAGALSGTEPLDWHDGQITTLDTRSSCGESTVSNDWLDR